MTDNTPYADRPAAIAPEDRDWTYVITEGCDECGYAPTDPAATGNLLRGLVPAWREALARSDARHRPAPTIWSPTEYGCHVRDTCRIFRERLELMLREDNPTFANWDQDATAVEDDYYHQDPALVLRAFELEAELIAAAFDAVRPDQWGRAGLRSNGSQFTVATFARYFLHDIHHHTQDVRSPA